MNYQNILCEKLRITRIYQNVSGNLYTSYIYGKLRNLTTDLEDPALLEHEFDGQVPDLGAHGVGVTHEGHTDGQVVLKFR